MVWHSCRWSQTLLPMRELKFSSVFLATRRPGMWTVPFPVDNILSEMCLVILLGWWTSSCSKKNALRHPYPIYLVWTFISWRVSSLKKITFHLSTPSDQSVGVSPVLVEALFLETFILLVTWKQIWIDLGRFGNIRISFEYIIWEQSSWSSETRRISTSQTQYWIISQCHWHVFLHVRSEMGVS